MKRVPMALQLILILFGVMVVPAIILTGYSGTLMLRYSEDVIARSALSSLVASRRLTENAMANISNNVVELITTHRFSNFRHLTDFARLTGDYNNISNAQLLYQELKTLQQVTDGAHSAFFYPDGADYIVATDNGIASIGPADMTWLETLGGERAGIYGVWHPRVMETSTARHNVITFLLPLSRLTTSAKGTVAVNLLESQIAEYLQPSADGIGEQQVSILMNENGLIISHPDKSLLLSGGSELPYIKQILGSAHRSGYSYEVTDGERRLYTYCKSEINGWVYVGIHSMEQMVAQTDKAHRDMALLTALIILIGTVIASLAATWLSRPARTLARSIQEKKLLDKSRGNELAFLDTAFRQIQEEEESLHSRLRERERDSESLLLAALLRGEKGEVKNMELLPQIFPERFFMVAVICIDHYSRYVSRTDPEFRTYHRYLYLPRCEEQFPAGIYARCVYRGSGSIGVIVNFNQEEKDQQYANIYKALSDAKAHARDIFGHTVTVGVSDACDGLRELHLRAADALEATKYRIIRGADSLIFWHPMFGHSKKYIYPANSERRILNYLAGGDLPPIVEELGEIQKMIRSADIITYDNILFIYNQLVGAAIKYLSENNIGTGLVFAERGNIYAEISAIDTIEEIEEYLRDFYAGIIAHLHHEEQDKPLNHGEQMLQYLNRHFREDILFENMAEEIGISYSYMRKLIRELTGKSLADYINYLRVQEMKHLFKETGQTVAEISELAGYRNVYSANRYFKKFEGMSPGEYKNLN
jgi:AraC-like DNA-binding protein